MRHIEHHAQSQQFLYKQDALTCVLQYHLEEQQGKPTIMAITHTGVPSPLEGQGIAADLAKAALEFARGNNWKVRPVCSYIDAYMRRHHSFEPLRA
ncbi:N-acetyltransferase [Pusillimonas sp. CC-YST705]|uniref:N-acetyltransferase n=1 Tax=Mesopusillimonas faecipullorum TaxID=2755040 RepID=A0ABS8C870_9BURK|nr:GNAT family N-acetyltransferase [Mesopusillimonas faecipullorum]MCB5362228.1 N-acetyltransferase [Mesopusillimonas faecipullorum]